jgi:acyl-homoserine lactone acylase PvdQ/putative cell wall-binding protein
VGGRRYNCGMRRTAPIAVLAALALVLTLLPAWAQDAEVGGRHRDDGDVGGFLNVMPPGQDGVLNAAELAAARAGGQFPPHFNDQTPLYDGILDEAGIAIAGEELLGISDGDLERFFKDASYGAAGAVEPIDVAEACGPDVVAFRDTAWGVPHIFGETREAAQCANGYATAQDRLFLMDLLRHIGYARLSEFLGASDANRAMDREQLLVAAYTDEEYAAQESALCDSTDPERQRVCADGEAYIRGVNAYIADARSNPSLLPGEYAALQQAPEDFVLRDIIATASLVGGIFGKGGGGEAANSMFLAELVDRHGPVEGRRIFDDLKAADDPDAVHTIDTPFPYNQHDDIDPSTTALLEPGSFVGAFEQGGGDGGPGLPDGFPDPPGSTLGVVDGPFGPIDLRGSFGMSNAILATAEVTDSGAPIAVFGPQTGYFTPQLLVETDLHAPGLSARGVAFAGTNIYVQLGRGRGYAWSATSASGDLVDEWALELCDPAGGEATIDSTGYVWDGTCREIDVFVHEQVAKPSAGGIPSAPTPDRVVVTDQLGRIPDLGGAPVVGRATTTDGTPVAIAEQRSTYGSELDSAVGFLRINDPEVMADGVEGFNRAFDGVDFTFNWFYVDERDIAYRHSCLCPIRDERTDPDLLTWGGRGVQWTGEFLRPAQQPQAVNPDRGWFANWNNKQAPGFRSQDDSFKHHSVDRQRHLDVRMRALVASGRPITRSDMVDVSIDAGTVDLNPQEIFPLALEVMGAAPPAGVEGDAGQLVEMRAVLAGWVAAGGHRRDLDGDGVYDHAVAVAIGDAWVRPLLQRVLGDEVPLELWPEGVEDHPRQSVGSAYNGGQVRFLPEDLRQVLDLPVAQERSRTYCADGTRGGCAAVLWAALADAAALLAEAPQDPPPGEEASCDHPNAYRFGSADPADWVYDARCDDIVQSAAGVVSAPPMRWQNRPTFHQVAEPGTATGRIEGPDRVATAAALSRHAFPGGAEVVVVAAAGTFADAVAGTPLAAAEGGPLLLTDGAALSPATLREVRRLGAARAVVLGGTAAVSGDVAAALADEGLEVERVEGPDRFATAVAIAERLGVTDRFVVASGRDFPDALAAGPLAVAEDRAILLVEPDRLPDVVVDAVAGAADVVVAGGPAAVSDAVVGALPGEVVRVGGADRYATADAFARRAVEAGLSADTAYAVTGQAFPDALTAGVVAARVGGVLVLLNPASLDGAPGAASMLVSDAATTWLVGGEAALPSALRRALEDRLG